MILKIEQLLKDLSIVSTKLYQNDLINVDQSLLELITAINEVYLFFINKSEEYKNKGIDIPSNILLSQIKNLLDANDAGDIIIIADTLQYEIYNGLNFCKQIMGSDRSNCE